MMSGDMQLSQFLEGRVLPATSDYKPEMLLNRYTGQGPRIKNSLGQNVNNSEV